MRQELHEAICGVTDCTYKQRYVSEDVATQQLYEHLRIRHHASTDPKTPSRDFYGWVRPYFSVSRQAGTGHWTSGVPTAV